MENIDKGVLPVGFFRICEMEYHELINAPLNKPETISRVKDLMENFDKLWNHFRQGGFFSRNEELDEYSTNTLKFFLIPYYIGRLHLLFQGKERPSHLEAAMAYLNAFSDEMVRMRLVGKEPPEPKNPNERRNRAVSEFKEKKELEERVHRMNKLTKDGTERGQLGDQVDEELERETVLDLLKLSVLEGRQNSRSAKDELPFALMHAEGVKPEEPTEPVKKPWFQRIDREQMRQKVFAPLEDVMPRPLPPDDETIASPGAPHEEEDEDNEEVMERKRIKQSKWDDWKDDHPPFSQE